MKLTTKQTEALENKIYALLMDNPETDMGDMSNCRESAQILVSEWIDENNIETEDE